MILVDGVPTCFGCFTIDKLHTCVNCEFIERCDKETRRLIQLRRELFIEFFTEGK